MFAVLSLSGWADVAQYVLAVSGLAAVIGAGAQLRISHHQARRERVFAYADTLNQLDLLRATAEHKRRWAEWTVEDLEKLGEQEQAEQMHLPNLVEDIAYLYNRKVLDRGVAAEMLGVYVEALWIASEQLVKELRASEDRPRIFIHWEKMQADTWKRRGAPGPSGRPQPSDPN